MAGTLTRKQIEDEALDNIAKSGVLTLQSATTLATRVTTWVNRAQLWLSRRADLLSQTYTTTTVTSQQSYSFPSNVRRVYSLRLIDGLNSRKLSCVMPMEMDRRVPNMSSITTARSWFYVPYSDTLTFELFPIPNDAYTLTLRASVYPTDFTSASAVSQYTNCDDVLVAYTTMFGFRWLQELKDAKDWEIYGNEIAADIIKVYDESNLYVDWSPAMDGFSAHDVDFTGDYYNNPFVRDTNLSTWWR